MELQETINTFNTWISPVRINKANAEYDELSKTQEGQLKILNDAKNGSTVAADYLFYQYRPIIAKAFWKYFLGPNKKYHAQRIAAEADKDFASLAYHMLLGAEDPSPYRTFQPSKFDSKANLIKQFGYYLYRYLQNEAIKLIRAESLKGMTGNVASTDDVKVSTYDSDEEISTQDTSITDVDFKETWLAYLKKLKKDYPKYYDVIKLRSRGLNLNQIASRLGVTEQSVRNYLKSAEQIYHSFTGDR